MIRANIHVSFIEWNLDVKESQWTCENCGASLNWQSSFNNLWGMDADMVCEECGHNNHLSVIPISNTLPSSEDIYDVEINDGWFLRDFVSDYLKNKYGFLPTNFHCEYEKID